MSYKPRFSNLAKAAMAQVLILLVPAGILYAGDEFAFSGVEERQGFGIPIHGRLSFESAWQIQNPDRWIRLGPSLNLIFDNITEFGQFYIEGTGRLNLSYRVEGDSKETRNAYELEPILREVYWKKNFNRFTVSAGKIIDDPSVMDLVQVVDKISVISQADAYFAEPEEVKQGQNMLKLAYYSGSFDIGLLFIPYPCFDRITDDGHPYALVKGQDLIRKENRREPEWGIQAGKRFAKGAVFGYAGRFNTRFPLLEAENVSAQPRIYKQYEPYWSVGGASNLTMEPFLFKWEVAYNFNKPLQSEQNGWPAGYNRHDQAELAVGMDLNLGDSGMVTMEYAATAPMDRDDALSANRTTWQGAASWSNNYLNDTLNISMTTLFPDSFKNMVNRFRVMYFFTDTLSVRMKYTRFTIREKEETYGYMANYDRIDFSLNYDFNLD